MKPRSVPAFVSMVAALSWLRRPKMRLLEMANGGVTTRELERSNRKSAIRAGDAVSIGDRVGESGAGPTVAAG
jgi:hypothetical protein